MRRAIQARSIGLDRVEEQHEVGAIPARMGHHRNWVAGLVRLRSPPTGGHQADRRGLDSPCSHRGRIRRSSPDCHDDVTMGVLPPVLLHDSPIRHVLAHLEHRAGMVGKCWSGHQGDSDRHCNSQQRPAPADAGSMQCSVHTLPRGIGGNIRTKHPTLDPRKARSSASCIEA